MRRTLLVLALFSAGCSFWPEGRVEDGEDCAPGAETMACSDDGRSVQLCGQSGVWFTRHACLPGAECGVQPWPEDAGLGPAGDGGLPRCLLPDGGSQGT